MAGVHRSVTSRKKAGAENGRRAVIDSGEAYFACLVPFLPNEGSCDFRHDDLDPIYYGLL